MIPPQSLNGNKGVDVSILDPMATITEGEVYFVPHPTRLWAKVLVL